MNTSHMNQMFQTDLPENVMAHIAAPGIFENPYPFYDRLRVEAPVYVVPCKNLNSSLMPVPYIAFLSRHSDVLRVFQDPLFGPKPWAELEARCQELPYPDFARILLINILTAGPAEHPMIRSAMSAPFSIFRTRFQEAAHCHCDNALDAIEKQLSAGEVVDIHSEFSYRIAMNTLADGLGMPEPYRSQLAPLMNVIFDAGDLEIDIKAWSIADSAAASIMKHLAMLVEQRRRQPADDIISSLISAMDAHGRDKGMTERDLLGILFGIWTLGFHTTTAALSSAVVSMLKYPNEAALLDDGPEAVKAFVSECLRFDPSFIVSSGATRIASRDTEIGGVPICAGTQVVSLLGAANRDPAVFSNPNQFIPTRTDGAAMLSFGHGSHYCIGARLAMAEMSIALPKLRARFPKLKFAAPPVYHRSSVTRTFESVMVTQA